VVEISYDELTVDEDQCYLANGTPFTGIAHEYAPTGARIASITIERGAKQGNSTEWYENGQIRDMCEFWSNMPHGQHREYSADGRLLLQETFEFGFVVVRRRHSADGKLIEDYSIQSRPDLVGRLNRMKETLGTEYDEWAVKKSRQT
jgi:antitoxin component YwqK of YwqJK toxin-antitoxin module